MAAVAADTEEQAIDAARLVKVTYDVMQHVANVEQAMASDAPVVFMNGNTRKANAEETGDIEAGFKQARTSSNRPTRRMSSRMCAWRRTAASASGTATS